MISQQTIQCRLSNSFFRQKVFHLFFNYLSVNHKALWYMKIAPSCVNENFCVHKKPYTVMAKSVVNQALGNPF